MWNFEIFCLTDLWNICICWGNFL